MTQTRDKDGWIIGKCEGCGTSWQLHELMNLNSPAVNNCEFCGRPKYAQDVIDRASSNYSASYSLGWWEVL